MPIRTPNKLVAGLRTPDKLAVGVRTPDKLVTFGPVMLLTPAQVYAYVRDQSEVFYACHYRTGGPDNITNFTRRSQDTAVGVFVADNPSPPTANSPDLGRVRHNSNSDVRFNKFTSAINWSATANGLCFCLFKPVTGEYIQWRGANTVVGSGGGYVNHNLNNANSASAWCAWKLADSEDTITTGADAIPPSGHVARFIETIRVAGVDVVFATYSSAGNLPPGPLQRFLGGPNARKNLRTAQGRGGRRHAHAADRVEAAPRRPHPRSR